MAQFEKNVVYSFSLVKEDIEKLQKEIASIAQAQNSLLKAFYELKKNQLFLYKQISVLQGTEIVSEKKETKLPSFVASRTGKTFHEENCPFAQHIKPLNKKKFSSKIEAFNDGFNACNCVQ